MNLVGPDGKAVWVDDSWVAKAKADGYKEATPEDVARAKAGEQPGLAAVEGVSRTLTPGITDPFLKGFYGGLGQRPDVAELRKEENPWAEAGGEALGVVSPFGAPAAISKLGAGAKALGAGAKIAERALQGGVETGLYGLGNAINESAMTDSKLTSEHVASETIAATLAGAGLNVVLGKFGDIGKSALVKAFGGDALKATLDDAANKAFGRAIGLKPSDLAKKSTRGNFDEIMQFGRDEKLAAGLPNVATVAERSAQRADRAWNEIDGILGELDQHKNVVGEMNVSRRAVPEAEAAAAKTDLGPNMRFAKQLEGVPAEQLRLNADNTEARLRAPQAAERENMKWGKPGPEHVEGETIPPAAGPKFETTVDMRMQQFDPKAAADRMEPLARELKYNPAAASARSSLESLIEKFRDPKEAPRSFQDAWQTASWMLKSVGQTEPEGIKSAMFKIRGELQDEIFSQAKKIDPDLGAKLQRANRDYYLSSRIGEISQRSADEARQKGGMYDAAAGMMGGMMGHAAFGSVLGGPLGAIGTSVVEHVARERGGFAMANALDMMSRSQTLTRITNALQRHVVAQLKTSPAFGGAFRPMLENAVAQGTDSLLEFHLKHWADPAYRAAVGMQAEPPETYGDHADRAHRFGALFGAVDAANQDTDRQIGRMLGTQGGRPPAAPERREPTLAEYTQIMGKLRLLTNPNVPSTSPALSQLAPTTAGMSAMQIADAAKYLLDRAPKNPYDGMPKALSQPWAPSKSEMRTWLQQVEVIANPRGLLDAMRRGDATPQMVECVKEVYPQLFQEFQHRLTDQLSDAEKPVSRKLKAQLDVVLGNLDDPQVTQLIQQTHKRVNPPVTAQPDGRQKVDVEKNLATQAQKMEDKS